MATAPSQRCDEQTLGDYIARLIEHRSVKTEREVAQMDDNDLGEYVKQLAAKKNRLYGEYQKARRDMQELVTIKANIDCLLGYSESGRKQEKER